MYIPAQSTSTRKTAIQQKKKKKRRQILALIVFIALIIPFFHYPAKAIQHFVSPLFTGSSAVLDSDHSQQITDNVPNKKPESNDSDLPTVQDPDKNNKDDDNLGNGVPTTPTHTAPPETIPEHIDTPETTPETSKTPEVKPDTTFPVETEQPAVTEPETTIPPGQGTEHEPSDKKYVALTFDDGPDTKYTPAILDILKQYNVKATFFVVGTQVEKHGSVLQRILDEGHSIGNHSYNHANLTKLSNKEIAYQIKKADDLITAVIGVKPDWIRAPYGAVNDMVKESMKDDDRSFIGWDVDTRDWAGSSVEEMRKNINENTKSNSIILMHSFGGKHIKNTVELLPYIIQDLQDKGFTLVTLDELKKNKA
ncbi:polysaccharide deacetylase family protein [Paenibacillus endoradicis]|uniref:polysaccharide deacetylase family protein n=1 Tax=Paenibacillus endoradicis TaxID=2972487 RepID=UPI0021592995|nr:polysaccharide deacetylase family protein [Paenibacillus endoradicis]MCR8656860.1 polysaccharide deacetylase family protein [Paenibacillus endoradicis]